MLADLGRRLAAEMGAGFGRTGARPKDGRGVGVPLRKKRQDLSNDLMLGGENDDAEFTAALTL